MTQDDDRQGRKAIGLAEQLLIIGGDFDRGIALLEQIAGDAAGVDPSLRRLSRRARIALRIALRRISTVRDRCVDAIAADAAERSKNQTETPPDIQSKSDASAVDKPAQAGG